MTDRFPANPCPGCGRLFELGDDAVAIRDLSTGRVQPNAWHRNCVQRTFPRAPGLPDSMGIEQAAFDWEAAAQRMERAGIVLDCVGQPELDITHLALTARGPELGGFVRSRTAKEADGELTIERYRCHQGHRFQATVRREADGRTPRTIECPYPAIFVLGGGLGEVTGTCGAAAEKCGPDEPVNNR